MKGNNERQGGDEGRVSEYEVQVMLRPHLTYAVLAVWNWSLLQVPLHMAIPACFTSTWSSIMLYSYLLLSFPFHLEPTTRLGNQGKLGLVKRALISAGPATQGAYLGGAGAGAACWTGTSSASSPPSSSRSHGVESSSVFSHPGHPFHLPQTDPHPWFWGHQPHEHLLHL